MRLRTFAAPIPGTWGRTRRGTLTAACVACHAPIVWSARHVTWLHRPSGAWCLDPAPAPPA